MTLKSDSTKTATELRGKTLQQDRSVAARILAAWHSLNRWLRRFTRYPTALVGLAVITVYVFTSLFGPLVAPYPYTEFHVEDALQSPSFQYLFGTDQFGRDVLSRVIVGSRDILVLSLAATTLGLFLGTAVGLFSGYYGGLLDEALMRLMDLMMSFPSLAISSLVVGVNLFADGLSQILRVSTQSWQTVAAPEGSQWCHSDGEGGGNVLAGGGNHKGNHPSNMLV